DAPARSLSATVFPSTTLFRSDGNQVDGGAVEVAETGVVGGEAASGHGGKRMADGIEGRHARAPVGQGAEDGQAQVDIPEGLGGLDRKSTRLNSSHVKISYAVF